MNNRFTTETEKELFTWLWKSQQELAKKILAETNLRLIQEGRENDWPALQEWDDLSGSSQAAFLREARGISGIPDDKYLHMIRYNEDAMDIIDELIENE